MKACRLFFATLAWATFLAVGNAQAAAQAQQPANDLEAVLGNDLYLELRNGVEVIKSSPLYGEVQPLTTLIRIAQPHYRYKIRFILVHSAEANAYSAPGGNTYINDQLLYFVKNREELAGTLCHELAHTIHGDPMKKVRENEKIRALQVGAILLHPGLGTAIASDLLGQLRSNSYSREQEAAADITGSDLCALAGYNPYGLIWLFEDFSKSESGGGPEILSDHPSNQDRIRNLLNHFRQNPGRFARFSPDRARATPLRVSKDAPIVFERL